MLDHIPGLHLFPANGEAPMNYTHNTYPFRQDSTFRYLTGLNLPDLVLTVDGRTGERTLYGNDFTLDDVIWMGERPPVSELAAQKNCTYGGNLDKLKMALAKAKRINYLPAYREERRRQLRDWVGHADKPSQELIRAIVAMREIKTKRELAEMDIAVATSMEMHDRARKMAVAGTTEAEVAGVIEGIAISAGGRLAYPAIVTRDGQTLHNHSHHNTLENGDLLLIDAGAEAPSGYAGDITRTPVVGGTRSERQQHIHDTVERAKAESIAMLRPGITYRSVHDFSARILTEGLQQAGLMKGDLGESVAAGAHALFFPHGLGHQIGLDVHDMEDLGEDLVGYDETTTRSDQFGTRNLRLGKTLRKGFALTVEPGIYFIHALIDRWKADSLHKDFINYDELKHWRAFGGIRLEDNVAITETGSRTLG